MATPVVMPQMGESIAEGTLSRWLKKVGDEVKRDEPIFEISTDKVDAEIPAPSNGVLAEILVTEGQTVPVQTVVARLETEKGAALGAAGAGSPAAAAPAPKAVPAGVPVAAGAVSDRGRAAGKGVGPPPAVHNSATASSAAHPSPAPRSTSAQPNGGLLVPPDINIAVHRTKIVELAARLHLPAIYSDRVLVMSGGLMYYGADRYDQFRRAASYVNSVLKGENVGDLPVQQPTKFELVINGKAARALGLLVPPSLLAQADEVIE